MTPVDVEQPRLGGKVQATVYSFDVRTFTFGTKNYFGVYGEDFLTFAEYAKNAKYAFDDEATLLKIFDDNLDGTVVDRHTFKFSHNALTYSRQVDESVTDAEIEHPIEATELQPQIAQTWSETLFYGLGNKNM